MHGTNGDVKQFFFLNTELYDQDLIFTTCDARASTVDTVLYGKCRVRLTENNDVFIHTGANGSALTNALRTVSSSNASHTLIVLLIILLCFCAAVTCSNEHFSNHKVRSLALSS